MTDPIDESEANEDNEESGEEHEESEEDDSDELMDEIQAELHEVKDPADRAKIMAVLYCGRALEKLVNVLYQRLSL